MNVYLLLKNVVSYFNSTSNHNAKVLAAGNITLFLISILHQTTTCFYFLLSIYLLFLISILHQTTTVAEAVLTSERLFLISILHQTTTIQRSHLKRCWLFLISILHQTTTLIYSLAFCQSCFLFQFYIKPQPRICDLLIVIRLCGRMNGTNGA